MCLTLILSPSRFSFPLCAQSFSTTNSIGTVASRVLRFVRLVRLVHLFVVFNDCCGEDEDDIRRRLSRRAKKGKAKSRFQGQDSLDNPDADDDDEMTLRNVSTVDGGAVGKRLNELTLKRVVCGVLIMAVLVPLLETNEIDDSLRFDVGMLHFNTGMLYAHCLIHLRMSNALFLVHSSPRPLQ